jgi:hypothetical protein
MTWNPPPEKDRPEEYRCLAYYEFEPGVFFWTECLWRKFTYGRDAMGGERVGMMWQRPADDAWYSEFDDSDVLRFAPLPDEATARIAELKAEVERLTAESERLTAENSRLANALAPRHWGTVPAFAVNDHPESVAPWHTPEKDTP